MQYQSQELSEALLICVKCFLGKTFTMKMNYFMSLGQDNRICQKIFLFVCCKEENIFSSSLGWSGMVWLSQVSWLVDLAGLGGLVSLVGLSWQDRLVVPVNLVGLVGWIGWSVHSGRSVWLVRLGWARLVGQIWKYRTLLARDCFYDSLVVCGKRGIML